MKKDKRKDKKEATKRKLIFIALAVVLVFAGCANPVAEDGVTEYAEGGTIVITLGNLPDSDNAGAARSATGMALVQHTILLHREADGSLYRTVGPHAHGSQVTITAVTPGSYTMTVNSTLGGFPYASGIPSVSPVVVSAYTSTAVSINMNVDFTAFFAAHTGGLTPSAPIVLPLAMPFIPANWTDILTAIDDYAGVRYVALDLTAMPMPGGTVFDPRDPSPFAIAGKDRIVSLILPDAALSIADGTWPGPAVFEDFSNLETVEGRRVTSIGDNAFRGASSLTSASFPLATNIGERAFSNASSLTSASFPLVTSIGNSAFSSTSSLTSVNFPLATSIGDWAFFSTDNLTNVSFPLVTSISNNAFRGSIGLTSVSFPLATSIGDDAFDWAVSLTNVSFPLVTSIGNGAFREATSLISASFPQATSIGNWAFSGAFNLSSVYVPLVTSIGNGTFAETTSLTNVSFPSVINIGGMIFNNAPNLVSITIAANVVIDAVQGINNRLGDFRSVYIAGGQQAGVYVYTPGPGWAWVGPLP